MKYPDKKVKPAHCLALLVLALIGLSGAASPPQSEQAVFKIQDGEIAVKKRATGIDVYIDNHEVLYLNSTKDDYYVSVGGNRPTPVDFVCPIILDYTKWQDLPVEVRRIMPIDGKDYVIVYGENGEIKEKTTLADYAAKNAARAQAQSNPVNTPSQDKPANTSGQDKPVSK